MDQKAKEALMDGVGAFLCDASKTVGDKIDSPFNPFRFFGPGSPASLQEVGLDTFRRLVAVSEPKDAGEAGSVEIIMDLRGLLGNTVPPPAATEGNTRDTGGDEPAAPEPTAQEIDRATKFCNRAGLATKWVAVLAGELAGARVKPRRPTPPHQANDRSTAPWSISK